MDLCWINWLPIYFLLRILNFDTIIGIWAGGRGLGFKRNIGIENWDRSLLWPSPTFILHPTLLEIATEHWIIHMLDPPDNLISSEGSLIRHNYCNMPETFDLYLQGQRFHIY